MNNLKTLLLMVLLAALMMFVGGLIGGKAGLMAMLLLSLGMDMFMYWFSDTMALKSAGAQEISREDAPQLFQLVEKLAANANLPMPKVCIINSDVPNAFATGRNPDHAAVAVTTGIMNVLDYNELSGVLAHELSHVKNRDILTGTIAAMMATVITYSAQFLAFFGNSDDEDGGNPIAALAMVILAPIAAMLIQMAISRSREYEADHDGGEICGNPNYLADALEKIEYYATHAQPMSQAQPATAHMYIVNPLKGSGKAIANLFSTHPETAERIARLRQQAAEAHIR
ncbi:MULTISPECIES: zinc metalloprotease HtpX [Selenomonas]|uniref:Protease HtpX homolog n=1 Tax=Selenomonas ruminis TaxID=2593411 RepID=A0A5D6W492_9FIRM|nr:MULTISPECIES: zinc metalloprotease HtpX [unclassified Selenomonas]MBQ1867419.1 zinc metalloprotease HtpX [Selenomonas sp.]TYZ22262.1 zinc metalloprotease HtpX [Selenomonas sp. mPRGC5]